MFKFINLPAPDQTVVVNGLDIEIKAGGVYFEGFELVFECKRDLTGFLLDLYLAGCEFNTWPVEVN